MLMQVGDYVAPLVDGNVIQGLNRYGPYSIVQKSLLVPRPNGLSIPFTLPPIWFDAQRDAHGNWIGRGDPYVLPQDLPDTTAHTGDPLHELLDVNILSELPIVGEFVPYPAGQNIHYRSTGHGDFLLFQHVLTPGQVHNNEPCPWLGRKLYRHEITDSQMLSINCGLGRLTLSWSIRRMSVAEQAEWRLPAKGVSRECDGLKTGLRNAGHDTMVEMKYAYVPVDQKQETKLGNGDQNQTLLQHGEDYAARAERNRRALTREQKRREQQGMNNLSADTLAFWLPSHMLHYWVQTKAALEINEFVAPHILSRAVI